jgi:serine/threonine protein kinase
MYLREDDRFQTKLCDFGLAVQRIEEMGRQGTTTASFGTPGYAAPEQYALPSSEQDARVDVFGLGMTLYWLLAGRLPWDATFANWPLVCAQQRRRTLQELQPALWREMSLDRFLERMTAVDRDERIATADVALAIIREGYSQVMSVRTATGAPPVVDRPGLSDAEIAWLIAWNIAAGEWNRVDLSEEQGRKFLLDLISKLAGDPLEVAEEAWMVLQRCLMALRREGFEDIQQEAPFSRYALSNMLALARAWMEGGEIGLLRKWADVFAPGWEARRTGHGST